MTLQTESLSPSASGHLGAPVPLARPKVWGGDVLAMGFAITVGVWVSAYVSRLPMLELPGQFTVGAMLTVILLGGFFAGRYSRKGLWAAVFAGALSGILDLIVVGSLFHDLKPADLAFAPSAVVWTAGSVLLNTVMAAVGGAIGAALPSDTRADVEWGSIFAWVLTAATLLLITAGGFVTAFQAGLAVPDWPQSVGYNMFLFPLSLMQKDSGKFFEHAHRLMGSLVGLTSLGVAVYLSIRERRWWVLVLAWGIFLGVGIQGVMGGLRVTEKSETLAIVHGAFAQVVFGAMAVLAAVTSRKFRTMVRQQLDGASMDRVLTSSLVALLLVQLILGTILRHTGNVLLAHITMAGLVTMLVLACGVRAWGLHGAIGPVKRSGIAVLAVVGLQVVLGVIALVFWTGARGEPTTRSAVLTTAHQVNGALLLACSGVLLAWTWRALGEANRPMGAAP